MRILVLQGKGQAYPMQSVGMLLESLLSRVLSVADHLPHELYGRACTNGLCSLGG